MYQLRYMVLFELILFILSLLVLGGVSDESYLACTSSFRNISGLDFKKKQGCVYLLNDENDARQYITTICACQDVSMLDHGTLLSLGLMTQDGHSAIAHVATGRGVKLTLFQGRSFDGHVAFVNEKLELSLSNKLDNAGQSMNKRAHSIKIKSQGGSCETMKVALSFLVSIPGFHSWFCLFLFYSFILYLLDFCMS